MIQVGNFQQEQNRSDMVSFSVDHIITYVMSICPKTEDVNFDYLIEVYCLSSSSILLIIFLICKL